MKPLYALLLLQIIWGGVNAQEINQCTVNICSKDLRQPIYSTVRKKIQSVYYGKTSFSYPDARWQGDGTCKPQPPGGAIVACETDESNTLVYDTYYPDYANYGSCPLPFIIFVHGGQFAECAGIAADGLDIIAQEFAKRGFVYFLVNYRSGKLEDQTNSLIYTTVEQEEAIYKAAQDIRGAIRSIIKRQMNEGTGDINDTFRVDLNNMFLGGNSAGAVTILTAAYYKTDVTTHNQSKIDGIFPTASGSVSFSDAFGYIDQDAYYGEPSIEYFSKIKGILNMWGGMFIPNSALSNPASYFPEAKYAPIISFHGIKDPVFKYVSKNIIFSGTGNGSIYYKDSHCMLNSPLIVDNDNNSIDEVNLGSKGIFDNILAPKHIFRELYLDCTMGHGLDRPDDMISSTPYCSDFGIGTNKNSNDVLTYIVQRACTFFQAIIGGNSGTLEASSSIHKVFIECENFRNKCTTANLVNNDCGDPSDIPCEDPRQEDENSCTTTKN
ncbi:MAG: hypothetical protein ABJA35_13195 [Parafilimonas sp.]